ncbi:MAG: C40 family peptidase [Melioribacteraceae bacterium]|nr:C40 family peptidase [Melioribacteraceae bacterium]
MRVSIIFFLLVFTLTSCGAATTADRYGVADSKGKKSKKIRYNTPVPRQVKNETAVKDIDDFTEPLQDLIDKDVEFDEEPPTSSNEFDRNSLLANYGDFNNSSNEMTTRDKILYEVVKYLDTPYKYGGNSEIGIDCSAFTLEVYKKADLISLPRSAREQFGVGEKISSKDELQFGDLVFFNTRRRSNPGHVGIYLGDNQFVHASRTLGVTVSSLDETYYKKRYTGARRVEEEIFSDKRNNTNSR